MSSGCDPTTRSQRLHCFQIRYCASPSVSIERVGAMWITLARQSSSRRRSSGRAGVEHQRARGARGVGDCEKLCGRKIDDEKTHAVGEHPCQGCDRIFAWGELGVGDREGLVEEPAGCVVVVHRHARAGDEVICRRDIEDRDRLAGMRLWMTPTLTASGSASAGWLAAASTARAAAQKRAQSACKAWRLERKAGRGLGLLVGVRSEHSCGADPFPSKPTRPAYGSRRATTGPSQRARPPRPASPEQTSMGISAVLS